MIKRIAFEQLRPGMFIHDLGVTWLQHPFLRNRFTVQSNEDIEKFAKYSIRDVYIDTVLGLDVEDAPPGEVAQAQIDETMARAVEAQPARSHPRPVAEELVAAHQVQREANQAVRAIMTGVQAGRQIEMEQVDPVVERVTESILRNRDALICLGRIKQKDTYTFQHSVNVCALLVSFCNALGLDPDVTREAGIGGLLHDVGKMKVPSSILNKPDRLSEEECGVMKAHASLGRDILRDTSDVPDSAVMVASQHHERFNGTGYPDRLQDEQISLFGKMASIVDVYDALTSDRVYHAAEEPTGVLRKLYEWSKVQFDEELVQRFIRTIGIYPVGSLVSLESGRLGVVIEQGGDSLLKPVVRVIFDLRQGLRITPRDVDLAQPVGRGGADRIVGCEQPDMWKINPIEYL